MKKLKNYIGQFRIYSAIDLVILLIAAHTPAVAIIGALLLNFGFMAHLEMFHQHPYRQKLPKYLAVALYALGSVAFYHIEGLFYILWSQLYVLKKDPRWGWLSPIFRGAQVLFLVAASAGYSSRIAWLAFGLIALRNFIGDLRDVKKDETEKMRTLPIVLGVKSGVGWAHLLFLIFTSLVWGNIAHLNVFLLLALIIFECFTYTWTAR
ncbi:MAG TPA: hypothetical protein VLE93_03520 [Candidatus Saccharimonadales bacterium]|nr:hypothetical protein [Candidatus Saccharimonadales bacterium]